MFISSSSWRVGAAAYRALVAGQTIAWAVISLGKVVNQQRRMVLTVSHLGLTLTIVSIVGLMVGVLAYVRGRSTPRADQRRDIIRTWLYLQGSGLFALTGYMITGEAICFAAGITILVFMHVFSPNRFERSMREDG